MNAIKLANPEHTFELPGCMVIMLGYVLCAAVLITQFLQ
jgi:hypothetical protein